jgi:hypothetical protein
MLPYRNRFEGLDRANTDYNHPVFTKGQLVSAFLSLFYRAGSTAPASCFPDCKSRRVRG